MLRGRLLTESLRVGAELAVPDLLVRRVGRVDVSSSASTTQPKVWTFLDFEAPDERADELAAALASALLPDDGWYANFEVADEDLSLIHISEPTRLGMISYAVFCLKKKKKK